MGKFSDSPYFLLDEFISEIVPYGYAYPNIGMLHMGPMSGIVAEGGFGFDLYVKTDTQFLQCRFLPLSDYADGNYFKMYLYSTSPSGDSFDEGDEVYFRKNSYFHQYIEATESYTNFANTEKTFLYFGKIYSTGSTNQYHVIFDGLKDYTLRALPTHNQTAKMEELLRLYFDKIYHEVYNKEKNIWTLKDPIETDIDFLSYIASMYNVDLREDTPLSNDRQREFVRDLIFWLKRKGTYASLYIIWRVIVTETLNQLNLYERWHDYGTTLSLDTFDDHLYTGFTSYSTSAADYPKGSEYAVGDKYLSTHYKAEVDLSYEPLGEDYIMSEAIIKNLVDTWDLIRPVSRVAHYQEYVQPVCDFSTEYKDLYGNEYAGFFLSKCCIPTQSPAGTETHIQVTPSTNWTIDHNFKNKELLVQFFDTSYNQMYPAVVYQGNSLDTDLIAPADFNSSEFTSGYGGWGFYAVNEYRVDSLTETGTDSTTVGASGSTCLKMRQATDGGYARLKINTTPSDDYRIRLLYYIKADEGDGIYVGAGINTNISSVKKWELFTTQNEWSNAYLDFTAGTNTYLFLKSGASTGEVAYFDDIKCYEANTPPTISAEFGEPTAGYAAIIDRDYLHTQEDDAFVWSVSHNLGNQLVLTQLIDNAYEKMFPADLQYTSVSAGTVTFGVSGAGTDSYGVSTSGYAPINVGVYTHVQASPGTTWNVDHNLESRGVVLQTYDQNYKRVIPAAVHLTDKNNVQITFDDPTKGYVRLLDVGSLISQNQLIDSVAASAGGYVKFGDGGSDEYQPIIENDVDSVVFTTRRNIEISEDADYKYITVLVRDKEAFEFTEVGFFDSNDDMIFYSYHSTIYKPENVYVKIRLKIRKE